MFAQITEETRLRKKRKKKSGRKSVDSESEDETRPATKRKKAKKTIVPKQQSLPPPSPRHDSDGDGWPPSTGSFIAYEDFSGEKIAHDRGN
jgi:hypothetical protein